jgi:acrylyl-CoA reductase (NADPH)
MTAYPAVVITEPGVRASIIDRTDADLPDGEVTIDVRYSSLNYKDGLAVSGKGKIARSVPMTCGIDLAGVVSADGSGRFTPGDEVLVTGWGLSEVRPGGYTHRQRVPASAVTPLPAGLTLARSMAVGTAGLTAALCVEALVAAGVAPGQGLPVLVTGAGGGVGSIAVALLAAGGFEVTASSGRPELDGYLRSLGATEVIHRSELATAGRPLGKERWAGAVDTVGSQTLATVCAQTRYGGAVAACGLAGGNDLPATVLPFILRGVSLLGVDSVMCPPGKRAPAWARVVKDLPAGLLGTMTVTAPMSRILELADDIIAGRIRGRVVIDVHA